MGRLQSKIAGQANVTAVLAVPAKLQIWPSFCGPGERRFRKEQRTIGGQ
jgi:hypothetical protein